MEFKKVMESKKAKVIAVVCVSLMLVIGGVAVIGAKTGGFGCGAFRGHHGKSHEFFLAHMDGCIETLNLSDSQMGGYKAIREKISSGIKEHKEKREQFMGDVSKEISQKNPDMEKVASMLREKISNIPDIASTHIDYALEFYNLLDDEQKQKVLEKARNRLSQCSSDT
ncbi:MAG: hypothetical protein GY795_36625 [Desulfobacterales bacterium]|nr:hypothetical protein [Desulfobacterales bacterium]